MTQRVDARGMRCPWPALRLARALRGADDAVIDIFADDPAAEREMTVVAEAAGYSLTSVGPDHFRATLRG